MLRVLETTPSAAIQAVLRRRRVKQCKDEIPRHCSRGHVHHAHAVWTALPGPPSSSRLPFASSASRLPDLPRRDAAAAMSQTLSGSRYELHVTHQGRQRARRATTRRSIRPTSRRSRQATTCSATCTRGRSAARSTARACASWPSSPAACCAGSTATTRTPGTSTT